MTVTTYAVLLFSRFAGTSIFGSKETEGQAEVKTSRVRIHNLRVNRERSREIGVVGSERVYADQLHEIEELGAQGEATTEAAMEKLADRVTAICEGAEVNIVGIASLLRIKEKPITRKRCRERGIRRPRDINGGRPCEPEIVHGSEHDRVVVSGSQSRRGDHKDK